ncbi:MAG: hypothetical protein QM539_10320, partial [Alphaproteobacteria bacterium]|nr:hypothetical protein [Alphaproteobacteria bacterium]
LFEFNKYFNVFDCSNLSLLKLFFITNSLIVVIAFISRQSKWDNPCICKVSNITTLKDKIMCCKICESNDKNQCPAKIIDKNKIENIVKKKENNLIFCNTYFECKFWDIFE